jgi:peptidyl-prolyl cis-trans isomerase SurA
MRVFSLLSVPAALGFAGVSAYSQQLAEPVALNGVAATVNGKVITRNELDMATRYKLMVLQRSISDSKDFATKHREAQRDGLRDLIDRELVISEFERLGAHIKPQYVDEDIQRLIRENFNGNRESFLLELRKKGISWPKFREQHHETLIVAAMRGQATRGVSFPTPEQKEEYFRKHQADFRDEGSVWFKTIAIPQLTGETGVTEEEQRSRQRRLANDIRRRLVDGADFASQAKTYSQDSKTSEGGDWGMQPQKALAPQLAEIAFSLPIKEISQVFEFRGLFYIMTVEERRPGKLKPQAEIDELLDRLVQAEAKKKVMEEFLAKLRKKATITYPDPSLRPQPETLEVRPALPVR